MRHLLERLLTQLLALVAERNPPETAVDVKPRTWRLPTVDELERARGEASAYRLQSVKICRGPGKGCGDNVDQTKCQDCFRVYWHDTRPSTEILVAVERGDA